MNPGQFLNLPCQSFDVVKLRRFVYFWSGGDLTPITACKTPPHEEIDQGNRIIRSVAARRGQPSEEGAPAAISEEDKLY